MIQFKVKSASHNSGDGAAAAAAAAAWQQDLEVPAAAAASRFSSLTLKVTQWYSSEYNSMLEDAGVRCL